MKQYVNSVKQYVTKKCILLYFSLLEICMRWGTRSLHSGALFSGSAGKGNRRKQSARWQDSSISGIRILVDVLVEFPSLATPEKCENVALFLRLCLPVTLVRYMTLYYVLKEFSPYI